MTVLLPPFQFGCLLLFLLVWFLRLGLLALCWTRVMKVDIPVFFLMLRRMLVVLSCWVWCWQWVCHLWLLLCLGMFPLFSLPTLMRVLIINGCWNLSNAFSTSIDMIMWFLSLLLFMWYITFIDLRMLHHPRIPGMNPTWSWCMIFLIYCWMQFANILLRILASMFIRDIGL